MKIRNILHKGLKRFYQDGDKSGLSAHDVDKIEVILTFLIVLKSVDELRRVPLWKVHLLTGDEKGKWSLNVTRNWRMTFRVNESTQEISDLNYEDYH